MQKIKAKIYAEAFYQSCRETSNIDITLRNFAKILVRDKKLSLLPQIIYYFNQIYNQRENAIDADIETAYELISQDKKMILQLLKKIKKVKEVFLNEKINPELLGGFVINVDDLRIDSSLKRKLQIIKKNIIK